MPAFSIWPLTIHRYGIMYLLAFGTGYRRLRHIGKKWRAKQRPAVHTLLTEKLDDVVFALIFGWLIGGRVGEVLIYQLPYYRNNPDQILAIRNGGMSFIGWIFGALVGLSIFFKKNKTENKNKQIKADLKSRSKKLFFQLLDHAVTIVPLGIFFGRIGNFINQELYGHIVPSNARGLSDSLVSFFQQIHIFHIYPLIGSEYRINTNLLAMLGEWLLIFFIIQLLYHRSYKKWKMKIWSLAARFIFLYSFIRFFIEFLRVDSTTYMRWPLSASQWIFILFICLSLCFLIKKEDAAK